jgi:hypothetical protein
LCTHYQGLLQCDAFPERIPQEILSGEVDHRKPSPGDGGIAARRVDACAD